MSGKSNNSSALTQESIYDFPKYYELAFGSDWSSEVKFLRATFSQHASGTVKRVLEPACGTGRILCHLAKAGLRADGFDLNEPSLEYCRNRMKRLGSSAHLWLADMAKFKTDHPYDAAYNMINSFRHLMDDRGAEQHFRCMARSVRTGGVYVLGLYLTPTRGRISQRERWSARRGNLVVNSDVRHVRSEPKARLVTYSMRFDIYTPTMQRTFEHMLILRSYTLNQFQALIKSVSAWKIEAVYDFRYLIEQPIEPGARTEDAVFVLKRR